MSKLEKIVYLGDLVSEDRRYPDVERYREYTFDDLDNAMYEALKFSIEEVMRKGVKLNRFTFQAYNYYHDRRK
jgi:HD superfamily phosphohydrolase YqeK